MALIRDSEWVRQSFLVNQENLSEAAKVFRSHHSALLKFTDGTPGGNLCINPLPQPTKYADPPPDLESSIRPGGQGMGSMYSEVFDDNKQVLHFRFGVPAYNSLTTFYGGFYNTSMASMARTGRLGGAFYWLGRAAGWVTVVFTWPLHVAGMFYKALKYFLDKPTTKFYYLKPTMPNYWSVVQTIVNQVAVNMGLSFAEVKEKDTNGNGTTITFEEDIGQRDEQEAAITRLANRKIHDRFPDIFKENGFIDVYAIANRYQRMARIQEEQLEQLVGFRNYYNPQRLAATMRNIYLGKMIENKTNNDFRSYLNSWIESELGSLDKANNSTGVESLSSWGAGIETNNGWISKFHTHRQAVLDDGSWFASFRVNYTGAVDESFSNSFAASDLGEKINSMSAKARKTRIDLAEGNIGDNPLADILEGAANSITSFIAGVADELNVSGTAVLGGAAFADLPKHWERADARLPSSSYSMDLVCPSNDPLSRMVHQIIPLAMILAGGLPLATGTHSHTSPFLCEYYDKGRCQSRLGMIKNISVTRGGNTNIGFNRKGDVLGIRVTFEVEDMSSIMAMPISQAFNPLTSLAQSFTNGTFLGPVGESISAVTGLGKDTFNDDTFFTDYMAILGNTSLRNQIYTFAKLRKRLAINQYRGDQLTSPAYWAQEAGNTMAGQFVAMFYYGSAKLDQ